MRRSKKPEPISLYAPQSADASGCGLLLKDELALRLRVTPRTIENRVIEGMPAVHIGRAVRYDYAEVLAWLKEPRNLAARISDSVHDKLPGSPKAGTAPRARRR